MHYRQLAKVQFITRSLTYLVMVEDNPRTGHILDILISVGLINVYSD